MLCLLILNLLKSRTVPHLSLTFTWPWYFWKLQDTLGFFCLFVFYIRYFWNFSSTSPQCGFAWCFLLIFSGYVTLSHISQKWCSLFSLHPGGWHMVSICPFTGYVNLDHLIKMASAPFQCGFHIPSRPEGLSYPMDAYFSQPHLVALEMNYLGEKGRGWACLYCWWIFSLGRILS